MTSDRPQSDVTAPRARRHAAVAGGVVRRVELLRLVFGAVWLIDAYLKWQPAFISSYAKNVAQGAQGQPGWLRPWFRFWRHVASWDPHVLAYATAAIETLPTATDPWSLDHRVERRAPWWRAVAEPGGRRGAAPA